VLSLPLVGIGLLASGCGGGASADRVVARYAEAVAKKDAKGVCALFSGGTRGDIDRAARGVGSHADCAFMIAWGWSADEGLSEFTAVDDVKVGKPKPVQGLMSVPLRARVQFDDGGGRAVNDLVWLVRDGGAWRIAKPSGLLAAVSHWGSWWDRFGKPTARPDLDAAERARVNLRRAAVKKAAAEEASWRSIALTVGACAGTATMVSNPPLDDPMDLSSNGNAVATAVELASIEVARATVTRSPAELCIDFWTRSDPPRAFEVDLTFMADIRAMAPSGKLTEQLGFDLVVDRQRAKLRRAPGQYADASIGRSGRHLQIRLARAAAPRLFQLERLWSLATVTTRPGSDFTYGDSIPRNGHGVAFPSGRVVVNR
jgi:hypothetical protein